jgi:hypothetical protein
MMKPSQTAARPRSSLHRSGLNSMVPSRFVTWTLVLISVLTSPSCGHRESETTSRSEMASRCVLEMGKAVPVLSTDGKHLYVEPQSLTLVGDDVVAIGAPVMFLDDTNAVARYIGTPVAGVRIARDGRAQYIAPPDGWPTFASPRVLHEPEATWHAIWADEWSNPDSGTVQLMYGKFDGRSWTRVTRIGRFDRSGWGPNAPSQLLRFKDGLALAAPVNQGVMLLTERDGSWSVSSVPPAHSAVYTALNVEEDGLVIAYVGYDASDSVALAVTRSLDGGVTWTRPVTVALGAKYDPRLVRVGRNLALIWLGRRAMFRRQGVWVSLSDDRGVSWSRPEQPPGTGAVTRLSHASVLGDQLLIVGESDSAGTIRQTWHIINRSGRSQPLGRHAQGQRWPLLASDERERLTMLTDTGSPTRLVSLLSHMKLSCPQ